MRVGHSFLHSCAAAVAAAAMVLAAAPAAAVDEPWDLSAQSLKRALAGVKGADAYPGAAAVVLFDRREVTVEDSGLSRTVQHTLTKALTPAGARELSAVTLPYDPLSADVEVLRCRVVGAAGAVREIDRATTQDHPDTQWTILWNSRHKLVPVGRLEVGDAVELVTRRVGFTYALLDDETAPGEARFVPPMKGHFYDIVPFWSRWPVIEQSYTVAIPAEKNLQYQFFNGGAEVNDRTAAGTRTVSVTMRNFKPAEREPGMVAWSDVAPKLLLTTTADWRAKAVWFHGVQEDARAFEVTPELQHVADEVTRGLTREEDRVAALTHWVAENIRYIGLHMGEGEGYTLHPASMTLRDRGGVCKDKAGILVALLRAAGLEAFAGMTMAGERIERIAADQFNHCITVWRRPDGTTRLLDPTWVPGVRELWSSREQQQEVLMGLPGGADLLTTPISPPEEHPLEVVIRSTLLADGTLKGTIRATADGQSDAGLRRAYRGHRRGEWPALDQGMLEAVDARAVVRVVSRTDPDDLRVPFTLEAEFAIPGYARVLEDGSLLLVPLSARHPVGVASRADEITLALKPKERAYPVRVGCSRLLRIEERMALPPGTRVANLPEPVSLDGPGRLRAAWVQSGGELRVDETLAIDRRIFEPDAWPSLRAALEAFRTLAKTQVLIEPAARGKEKA
jgi:transglutaminase-like putative cysteine protease